MLVLVVGKINFLARSHVFYTQTRKRTIALQLVEVLKPNGIFIGVGVEGLVHAS